MNLIFYFHGYGSSPNTDKVARLREAFPNDEVLAPSIPVDYRTADRELSAFIMNALLDHMTCGTIVFIGTSLGGYWAMSKAREFGVASVLINPSFDPAESLQKYGENTNHPRIHPLDTDRFAKYFFADVDEVIPNTALRKLVDDQATIVAGEDHRFNRHGFQLVIDHVKHLFRQ